MADILNSLAKAIHETNKNKAAYAVQITSGEFEGKFVGFNFNYVGLRSALKMVTDDFNMFKNSLPFDKFGNHITNVKIVKVRNAKER